MVDSSERVRHYVVYESEANQPRRHISSCAAFALAITLVGAGWPVYVRSKARETLRGVPECAIRERYVRTRNAGNPLATRRNLSLGEGYSSGPAKVMKSNPILRFTLSIHSGKDLSNRFG